MFKMLHHVGLKLASSSKNRRFKIKKWKSSLTCMSNTSNQLLSGPKTNSRLALSIFWAVTPSSSSCDFPQFIPRFDKSSLKRGLCRRGGMNGQSWNWPNRQVQVQESTNRIVKHFQQSNIFVNQMLSMWKLLSASDSDTDQILGDVPILCKYVYFYTCLLSPPPLYKMLKNKRDTLHNIR